ncbi:MAG: cation:proton antiporter [Rhizobiaceae bacterium]
MTSLLYPISIGLIATGAIILLTAWLPLILRSLPLSLPIVAVAIGYFAIPHSWSIAVSAGLARNRLLEHLVELVILIALMGVGLRTGRPLSWRGWSATWRLLGIAMPISIAAIAICCGLLIGFSWPLALFVGAALAPTDPVLAADVQAGPPGEEEGGETRFALTSEAGLNDGLAFPFVLLAMSLTNHSLDAVWREWLVIDVIWKIGSGVLIGLAAGWAFGWLCFRLPRLKMSRTGDGLVAVGVALISYGVAELARGYGFIAVFIMAATLRAAERDHEFHAAMAGFTEQIERVLMVLILIGFGNAVAEGLFRSVGWPEIALAALILLVIRPAAGWLSLIGSPLPAGARALIAFFGVRGMATFYYVAYATGRGDFAGGVNLWATTGIVVFASVLLHGITSMPLMRWADRKRRKNAPSGAPSPADDGTSGT